MRQLYERAVDHVIVWGTVLLLLPKTLGRMRGAASAQLAIAKAERAVRRKIQNARDAGC